MNKKKRKNRERENEQRREGETKKKTKHWKSRFLDFNSSVEVGYGLFYFIVNS